MKRILVATLCLIGFALGASAPVTAAPRPVVAFVTRIEDNFGFRPFGLRVSYSDGSVGDPINPPQTNIIDPAWSPDGSRLAFAGIAYVCNSDAGCHYVGSTFSIWVMNSDGTGAVQIQVNDGNGTGRNPKWSPDGKRIIYTRWPNDEEGDARSPLPDLWVLTETAGAWLDEPLVGRPGYEYLADVSPDGRQIVYGYAPDDDGFREKGEGSMDFDLFVSATDGSDSRRRLTRMKGIHRDMDPTWSPDGRKIAFGVDRDLWMVRADGSRLRRILEARVDTAHPDFSPDGKKIAFAQCWREENCRILTISATRPHVIRPFVDVPEAIDVMPDYFPLP